MTNQSHQMKWIHAYDMEKPSLPIHFSTETQEGNALVHGKLQVFDTAWGDLAFAAEEMDTEIQEALDVAQEQLVGGSRIVILETVEFPDTTSTERLASLIAEAFTNYLQSVLLVHLILVPVPSHPEQTQASQSFFDTFPSLGFESVESETGQSYFLSKLDTENDSCRFL